MDYAGRTPCQWWTQSLADWTASHVRMFEYLGVVSELLIPENLASGVSKACRYDPEVNPTYQELATHYGTAVLPTRKASSHDKAKVKTGVLVAERWLLTPLRNHSFFSLAELNREIACLLDSLNHDGFPGYPPESRRDRPIPRHPLKEDSPSISVR